MITQLKVGAYNIAGGKSSLDKAHEIPRLERLLSKIRSLDCDVLGLVEVLANPEGISPNVAEIIAHEAREAGYYSCFGLALSDGAFPERVEQPSELARGLYQGNMILSRHPISRYHSFLISDFETYDGDRSTEPRHLLVASIECSHSESIYFAVTHLHTIKDRDRPIAADVRKIQCERILDVMHRLPDAATRPQILVGDFNNNPYLDRSAEREPEIAVLLRCFADLSESSGSTRSRRANGTVRNVRIDRIFGNERVRLVRVYPDGDLLDGSGDSEMFVTSEGLRLSDHRPVVAEVRIV